MMSSVAMKTVKYLKYASAQSISFNRLYNKNILKRKPIRVLTGKENNIAAIGEDLLYRPLTRVPEKDDSALEVHTPGKNDLMVPPYVKLQKNDADFTKLLGTIKNRKAREKSGKILLEGKRLINDAINAGLVLQTLLFSREKDLADIKIKHLENVKICKVFYKTLQLWSYLTTCPGVMGIFKRPTVEDLHTLSEPTIPVTLVCDNIRDPGNLGSIIRNAAATGCENILLTKGCVDPWESKVLRTACGGHFRIPIVNEIEWPCISNYIAKTSTIFIADNSADIEEQSFTSDYINFDEPVNTDEELKYTSFNEHNQQVVVDESYNEPAELEKFEDVSLPCHLYSSIKYPKKDIVLYVGGETHGVDSRALKLACEYGGKKIKIPLENGMESLNSSFALTVILYEIKRQLSEKYVTK